MKQIIPFKKELPFMTKVCDITSISLEREINVTGDGIISGVFHITGDYKMNEGSISREDFSFDLPFDISLDPRYDIETVNTDIEDFYYDIINEDTLKVNIDLFVEADYLPEPAVDVEDTSELEDECEEEEIRNSFEEVEEEVKTIFDNNENIDCKCVEKTVSLEKGEDNSRNDENDFASDLFSNLDNAETYTTYYVYIVKEEDTLDKILVKYGIAKEEFENYNDIMDIKPGNKVIIPKKREE